MCLGGSVGPGRSSYTETHWQQYYAAYCMAYNGHDAPAVPQRPAQSSGILGTFYLTFNFSISASSSWVGLNVGLGYAATGTCCGIKIVPQIIPQQFHDVQHNQDYLRVRLILRFY